VPDKEAHETSSHQPDRVHVSQRSSSRPFKMQSKSINPKPNTRPSTPASESGIVSYGELRALRAKAQQANTSSHKRGQPSQTPQSASSTFSQPTLSAELDSYTHNHKPSPSAKGSTSCRAHTPSAPELTLPNIGPRQSMLRDQEDTEVSPNPDVDIMVLVPMPQPGPPLAPSQGATSATPVASQPQAEKLGTASTTRERFKTPDRSRLPGTSAIGQKGHKGPPSNMAQESQESQDTVAETIRSSTAPSANTIPKPETPTAGVKDSPSLSEHLGSSTLSMPQPQIIDASHRSPARYPHPCHHARPPHPTK
jgi:hypothetical protein